MEQLKQAIAIIKTRWQEVVLVFGLFLMGSFATALISPDIFAAFKAQQAGQDPQLDGHVLLYMVFSIIVTLISFILYIGFVRTVHLQAAIEQPVVVLLKTGQKFFWRIVGFMLLYNLILSFFIVTINRYQALGSIYADTLIFAVMLTLIKPVILIPALIIVLDCGILKSLGYLRDLKLVRSKELIVLFCMQALIFIFFPFSDMDKPTWYYILGIFPKALIHFIRFIIFIIAARLVSSYNLKYEPVANKVTSEGLLDQ